VIWARCTAHHRGPLAELPLRQQRGELDRKRVGVGRDRPAVVDGLGVLCIARELLTLDGLGRVARWTSTWSRQAFVRGARGWLIEIRRTSGASEYWLHHDSIRMHIAEAIGSDALARHHLALAERLATWPTPRNQLLDDTRCATPRSSGERLEHRLTRLLRDAADSSIAIPTAVSWIYSPRSTSPMNIRVTPSSL
jgi:hypothetical protein